MKRIFILLLLAGMAFCGTANVPAASANAAQISRSDQVIADAFEKQRSGIQVRGEGTVVKVLADDTEGDQHQRFILKLTTGHTLLIAHNIDIAPRVDDLKAGDTVAFCGVYEWNKKGGVIHWTHSDPRGRHTEGWLKKGKETYK